jgi:hypothetical protein
VKILDFLSNALLIVVSVLAVFVALFGTVAIEGQALLATPSLAYHDAAFLFFALMWASVLVFVFVKLAERLTR